MRPIALSRFDSSNRSPTNVRSAPRSPRNFSSVRGSRPSPSAKFWRSTSSSARAAFSLVAWVCASSASNSRRMWSTLTVTPASWSAVRPIRSARSTSAGRSSGVAFRDERGDGRIRDVEPLDDEPVSPSTRIAGRRLGRTGAERASWLPWPASWAAVVTASVSRASAAIRREFVRLVPARRTRAVARARSRAASGAASGSGRGSRSGLATTAATQRARDVATLRRWRLYRNSMPRGASSSELRRHRVDRDRRLLALELVDRPDARAGQRLADRARPGRCTGATTSMSSSVTRRGVPSARRRTWRRPRAAARRARRRRPPLPADSLRLPACSTRQPAEPAAGQRPGAIDALALQSRLRMQAALVENVRRERADLRVQAPGVVEEQAAMWRHRRRPRRAGARAPTRSAPGGCAPWSGWSSCCGSPSSTIDVRGRAKRRRRWRATSGRPRPRTARRRRRASVACAQSHAVPATTSNSPVVERGDVPRSLAGALTARVVAEPSPSSAFWIAAHRDARRPPPSTTFSSRFPITLWPLAVMPTRLPAATSSTIIRGARVVSCPSPAAPGSQVSSRPGGSPH